MIATEFARQRRPALIILLAIACTACTDRGAEGDRPAPPETAAPAPATTVTPQEDRGHPQGEAAAPAAEDNTFSNVESGESERAASQRGHESAGEQAPGN